MDQQPEDDLTETVKQAYFVMEDNFKIHKILDADHVPFPVIESLDISNENNKKGILRIKNSAWSHAHIESNSITYEGVTHNLKTYKSNNLTPPSTYFGLKHRINETNIR